MSTTTQRLADGTDLALTRAGDPAAELTVVLAHSYAQDRRVWHKIVDVLPDAVERPVAVIAYDHRGHGASGPADAATATVEQLGDDLAEIVRAVPGRVVLAGHGMGGLTLMALATRHQELFAAKVAGLAYLSTTATSLAGAQATLPNWAGRLVQDLRGIFGSRIVDHVGQRMDKAKTIGLRWLLLGDDPDPADVALVADMVAAHWPDTVALFRPALDRYGRGAALAVAAGTPIVAMVGEKDRLVPASHAEALAVHDGTAVVLPGLGHMLPLEGAAQVLPRIAALVNRAYRE